MIWVWWVGNQMLCAGSTKEEEKEPCTGKEIIYAYKGKLGKNGKKVKIRNQIEQWHGAYELKRTQKKKKGMEKVQFTSTYLSKFDTAITIKDANLYTSILYCIRDMKVLVCDYQDHLKLFFIILISWHIDM